MQKNAVFADIAIILNLNSTTGLKYTTKNCIECGSPLVERNGDDLFRITNSYPQLARPNKDGVIPTACNRCQQKYDIVISHNVNKALEGVPLYMQPQTIFMAVSSDKKLRDTHCLECGKALYSVSDRYSSLSDNTIPFDLLDPNKLGPMEVWCKFQHCKQRWSIMT